MQITVNTKEFGNVLKAHKKVVAGNNTMHILDYALLDVTHHECQVISTDLNEVLITPVPGEVAVVGRVLIPVAKCLQVLKSARNDTLILALEDDKFILSADNFTITIQTLPVDDYPIIIKLDDFDIVNPPIPLSQEALSRVSGVIPPDKATRFFYVGMLLHIENNCIRMVGTDGHRLAVQDCSLDSQPMDISVIISKKMALLLKMYKQVALCGTLRDKKGHISHLYFNADGHTLITRTMDEKYPNYQNVIPECFQHEVVINRKLLADTLEQILFFCGDKYYHTKFEFDKSVLNLTYKEAVSQIPVKSGIKAVCNINGKYVLDMLKHMSDELIMCFTEKSVPTPIKFVDTSDNYFQIIMELTCN